MTRHLRTTLSLSFVFAVVTATVGAAQQNPDFRWEKALAAGSQVSIHNVAGDVAVKPSTSGRVEVLGFKHGRGDMSRIHAEVRETSRGVVVCVVDDDTDWSCDENGLSVHGRDRDHNSWNRGTMNLQVAIPANLNVRAGSVSGDVSVDGAQGDVHASSVSGDVHMSRIRSASIYGHSVSGDVSAQIDALTGRGDLSFKTVSGDVTLELPRTFDADLSMSTVSGRMESDYPLTLNGRTGRRNIEARIGNGGRSLDIGTVSGNVRLKASR